jgi:hypothetical protein
MFLPVIPPENATENEYLKATAIEIKKQTSCLMSSSHLTYRL